jgi:hypothetical protein
MDIADKIFNSGTARYVPPTSMADQIHLDTHRWVRVYLGTVSTSGAYTVDILEKYLKNTYM